MDAERVYMRSAPTEEDHSHHPPKPPSHPERRGVSRRTVINEAKANVTTLELAEHLCPRELQKAGKERVSRCPLPDHEDKTPSFYVYPPGRYWCYGCSRGGDVVDLEFFCGDYGELWEAVVALAAEHRVDLPRRPDRWHSWNGEKHRRRNMVRDAVASVYQRRLFRIYAPILDGIEDEAERQEEAAALWKDLRRAAVAAAEYRVAAR